jgi:hypothetical protein
VRIGNEIIDGNADSTFENPRVPTGVSVAPHWGPITETPKHRRPKEHHGAQLVAEVDVEGLWCPTKDWINLEMRK